MKWLAVFVLVLLILGLVMVGYGHAQSQGLYLSNGNGWVLSGWYTADECDKAARRAVRDKIATGAGCAPFNAVRDAPPPVVQDNNYVSPRQQRIDERNQIYENRRERYERQFTAPTPR